MNIFVLDNDIEKCAEYHCDKHVVKMLLEYAQLLSGAVRLTTDLDIGYKLTHKNHPCSVWVRESLDNWNWLKKMSFYLNEQYKRRYNKQVNHKSFDVIQSLPVPKIESKGITKFALAMPDYCKCDDVVESYRKYYNQEKQSIATWKNTVEPYWKDKNE